MKALKHIIKPLLGATILYILIKHGGIQPALLIKAFQSHPAFLSLGFTAFFALVMAAGVRWFILVKCVGIPAKFTHVFSLHMIGQFFVSIIPGGTGGDVVKGYYIYRDTPEKKTMALVSIVMDRMIGIFTLLFWGVLGCVINWERAFFNPKLQWTSVFYLCTFGFVLIIVIIFFSPLGARFLNWKGIEKLPGKKGFIELFEAIQVYRSYPWTLITVFFITLAIHGTIVVTFYFNAMALDVNLALKEHSFAVPILMMVNGMPISPGGMGVGEAAAVSLYSLMNIKRGGEIFVLYHIYMLVLALLGAPFYFLYKKRN